MLDNRFRTLTNFFICSVKSLFSYSVGASQSNGYVYGTNVPFAGVTNPDIMGVLLGVVANELVSSFASGYTFVCAIR